MTDRTRTIKVREVPDVSRTALTASGISPVLARVLAARGIKTSDELDDSLTRLAPIETRKTGPVQGCTLNVTTQQWFHNRRRRRRRPLLPLPLPLPPLLHHLCK